MDFEFSPDILMLRDMLRRFVQNEARPLEMKYFNTGDLEPDEWARLRKAVEQLGLWGLTVPEAYGGGGLDTITACLIEEELGKTFIPVETGEVTPLLYACQGDQVGRFLEPALMGERQVLMAAREPGALQPEGWKTAATLEGDEYILAGTKSLSALPGQQDFFIVLAKITADSDSEGLTAFILDADHPGLLVSKNGPPVLSITDVRAGKEAILGAPGKALEVAMEEAPRAWIRTGARYVGIGERLIELAVEHAKDWVSLGAALSVRPAIQRALAEMRIDVDSVRWLVYHAAWLADKDQGHSIHASAAQVRLASGEMLQRCIDRVTMVFAGPGPAPQIDPQRLAYSLVPPETLKLTLEQARMAIAAEMLDLTLPQEGS
jgi:acyl-CoA dehydrogenase